MKQSGFTIFHLMIAICVIGVLVVVALPMYADLIFSIAR